MKTCFILLMSLMLSLSLSAQDDLSDLLDSQLEEETVYTNATFKSTRVINGHSIERMPEGQLDFRISHRFGKINSGSYNLWGLDQANIHFGLDYGVTNWLMVGIGRGTYEKPTTDYSNSAYCANRKVNAPCRSR